MSFQEIMAYSIWGNTVKNYSMSFGLFLLLLVIILVIRTFLLPRFKSLAQKTSSDFDDVILDSIEKHAIPFAIVAVVHISLQGIWISDAFKKILTIGVSGLLIFFAVRFILSFVIYGLGKSWNSDKSTASQRQSIKVIQTIIQIVVWALASIVLLDNLGIKITTLVAGLGVGGIAVALASQAVLGDVFAFFMILVDHPFEIGDFIIVDSFSGTVEHIGIKSSRIRSLDGELLVFRNTDLTNSRIRNFKKMEQRRVLFTFGITYNTELSALKEIPDVIGSIVKSLANTRFDRAHFKSYGESALMFEVVYYVTAPDYNVYMDIQQAINLKIREEFDKRSIQFAFPTRSVYLTQN